MLQKIFTHIIRKQHPWRDIKFDELAELYTSMSIRSLGFGLIGIFVPLFLYQHGVNLQAILWFLMWVFLLRLPLCFVDAYIVARIGPKHAIALSTLFFIFFLSTLLTFEYMNWPLVFLALLFTMANGLFFIAYNTDFSKIKNTKHGGKELGWLYIFERIGGSLGPFIGGLIASVFSPEITILAAIAVLLSSLVPLFMSNEPVRVHQTIRFEGFPWRRHIRDITSMAAFNVDNVASVALWPLYIGVTVFAVGTYAKLGSLIAGSMVFSLLVARTIGKHIDASKGLSLLRWGTIFNFTVHLLRSYPLTALGASFISTLNEPITLSYRMPLVKGYYDAADSEEGYRIVYLSVTELTSALAKGAFFATLYLLSYHFETLTVMRWSFIAVAIVSLGILTQRFPALKKS